ncbi:geranylgeranyl diphosphate synthase type II [Melghirimyces profundicolus]|uniref:Farnesyl diphosphate synthase n=1 Tax=Melghirimyces profundicolus TaxID=1242148 RepID=A0A2T6BD30_9BACL|nr:farnesyl diphosphate synthase [Melghirimyces profundicolus]PTX53932.1 geranylgeranyl diphosphate synthase type II [Melghirimyces profundicolus]
MREIEQYLKEKAVIVEERLRSYVNNPEIPDRLRESMAYSLLAGGKRLRPILVLAVAEALGGSEEKALPFACAVEMIHTYSLIHDDLPSMDNDDFRRGIPTNHKVYGEAMAILAGDALLTKAFGVLAEGALNADLSRETALGLIRECAVRAGAEGMVGGQVKDLQGEGRSVTLEELQEIHRSKTGDLITLSVRLGSLVSGASEDKLQALTGYAERLGLAFQIQDDVLDVVGDREKLGKPIGSDEQKEKSTYPALMGLEDSKKWVRKLVDEAKSLVLSLEGVRPNRLLAIADYLTYRES